MLPNDFLIEMGAISVSFAMLEQVMRSLVAVAIDRPANQVRILTVELAFKNLRAVIVSLYKERGVDDPIYLRVKECMRKANTIEQKRNIIIHSVWVVDLDDDTKIIRVKTTAKEGHGLKITQESWNIGQLKNISLDCNILVIEIMQIYDQLTGSALRPKTQDSNL